MVELNISTYDIRKLMSAHEELRLVCRKCNKEWTKVRPKGYYVRYKKGNNYLVNRRFPDKIEYFECPKCGNTRSIGRLTAGRKIHP